MTPDQLRKAKCLDNQIIILKKIQSNLTIISQYDLKFIKELKISRHGDSHLTQNLSVFTDAYGKINTDYEAVNKYIQTVFVKHLETFILNEISEISKVIDNLKKDFEEV